MCAVPLGAKWIPAHKLESIPEQMIDEDMARANHSTVIDIVRNRKADHAAKRAALMHALIDPALYDTLCHAVSARHVWLAQLCKLCGQDTAAYSEDTDDERLDDNQPAHVLFPLLPWRAQESDSILCALGAVGPRNHQEDGNPLLMTGPNLVVLSRAFAGGNKLICAVRIMNLQFFLCTANSSVSALRMSSAPMRSSLGG